VAFIILNGVSSSGKSTLARCIQELSDIPYYHLSIDNFLESFPKKYYDARYADMQSYMSDKIIFSFNKIIESICESGIDLIVDLVMNEEIFHHKILQQVLENYSVFIIGVHCSEVELIRREKKRRDRYDGLAVSQLKHTHNIINYDFEVETSKEDIYEGAKHILDYVENNKPLKRANAVYI